MDNLDTKLAQLDDWQNAILANLSPAARAREFRKIASYLRGSTAKRIAAQKNPDGTAFAPRKPQKQARVSNKAMKFLYPEHGDGKHRLVLLKSWMKRGSLYTGFDVERGATRSFEKSKILKHLPLTAEEENKGGGVTRQRSTIKSRIMFRKLRTYRDLRAGSSATEVWAGYSGRAADIGRVHQDGGLDRPSKNGPRVRYPARRLLGLTPTDIQVIGDMMIGMVARG